MTDEAARIAAGAVAGAEATEQGEKTEWTAEELQAIEALAEKKHALDKRERAEEYLKDKKVIGIATKLAALHLDTAIEAEKFLFHHWLEAKRQVLEAMEAEGMEPIEDITLQLRVSVMVQPKGTAAAQGSI